MWSSVVKFLLRNPDDFAASIVKVLLKNLDNFALRVFGVAEVVGASVVKLSLMSPNDFAPRGILGWDDSFAEVCS